MINYQPTSRKGVIDLAQEQMNSGQIWLPSHIDRKEAVEKMQATFVGELQMAVGVGIEPLSTRAIVMHEQLRSLVPRFLSTLFKQLDITPGKDGVPDTFSVAEPFVTKRTDVLGYYRWPFSAIAATPKMEMFHHAITSVVHELVHAMGKIRIGIEGSQVRARQQGMGTINQKERGISHSRYVFFNEACAVLSEHRLLVDLLGFKENRDWTRTVVTPEGLSIGGVELRPIIEKVGLGKWDAETNKFVGLQCDYAKCYQGAPLEGEYKDWEKFAGTVGFKEREYNQHDLGYAELMEQMRRLAAEIYPTRDAQSAETAFHRDLMLANLSGDLARFHRVLSDGLGPNGKLYARALACLSHTEAASPDMVAFVCFVTAGTLPVGEREAIRTEIARGVLKSRNLQC